MNESFETVQKFCPQCGEVADVDARFCKYCASDLANSDVNQNTSTEINQTLTKNNTPIIVLGAIGLLVVGVVGLVIFMATGKNNQSVVENVNSVSQTSASTLTLGEKGKQIEEKILRNEALTTSDLEGLSASELRILRNVHFARYGRKYERPGLGDYFYTRLWYKPRDEYKDTIINETDKENINLIVATETSLNSQSVSITPTSTTPEAQMTPDITMRSIDKLSRSEAARLIESDKNFGKLLTMGIRIENLLSTSDLSKSSFDEALVSQGYAKVENRSYMSIVHLTEKGRREAVSWEKYKQMGILDMYNIPYAKREIVEVTGISELNSGSFAQATFIWRTQPSNEIGRAMDKSETEQTFNGEAFFQKFDDGWRLVRISGRGLPSGY